jgi:sulfur-carrier protein
MSAVIRVELPANLCRLAKTGHVVQVAVEGAVTQRAVLDALEAMYPMLQGTIRDHTSGVRRAFIRFFACEQDLSHLAPDDELPEAVVRGDEPFLIVGAIAGG